MLNETSVHLEVRLAHLDFIGRVLDDRSMQHLAQIFHRVLHLVWLAEGQRVVIVRQLRARASTDLALSSERTSIPERTSSLPSSLSSQKLTPINELHQAHERIPSA